MHKIWITWEKHRRTSELASALNDVKLFIIKLDANRLIRYPYLLYRTLSILWKEGPEMVITQNPSVVLSFFMVTIGKLFTNQVIVDAHNEGLKPFYSKLTWLMPLYRLIQRRSDLTIVTNERLASEVRKNGGRPYVLEDKIPQFNQLTPIELKGKYNVTFVCTFEKDEPYLEVIRSASLIDPSICVYVTGKYEKVSKETIREASSNIVFTGFMSDRDYKNLLFSSDVIMDLTLMEDCLVCGAYEAVGMEKPMILSNKVVLKKYFSKGAVYTENEAKAIASGMKEAVENRYQLQKDVVELKKQLPSEWERKLIKLNDRLNDLGGLNN